MDWERRTWELLDDLEQQAEGLAGASRDADAAALGRAEYAEVDLAARLHAGRGCRVRLRVLGGADAVTGALERVGDGWCLVAGQHHEHGFETLVAVRWVTRIEGLPARADTAAVRPVTARLRLTSVLRRLAEEGVTLTVLTADAGSSRGRLRRVGADFLELVTDDGVVVVPLATLVLLRRGG